MGESKLIFNRARALPLLALLLVSAVCMVLVGIRIQSTHNWKYASLLWNLLLAWLPLIFAFGACECHRRGERLGWKLSLLTGLWLLFFPNAPYIFTDLMHLTWWFRPEYWLDFSLVLLVALTGFLLGFVSLYLMQSIVESRFGRTTSWLFVAAIAGLSGFGIYLGRILRWNSWDAIVHPLRFSQQVGQIAAHPMTNTSPVFISALFATFLFFGYLMLYALTHLQAPQPHQLPEATA